MKYSTTEVMRMAIWISQLIRNCIQKEITSFGIQVNRKVLENVHVCAVCDVRRIRHEVFASLKM